MNTNRNFTPLGGITLIAFLLLSGCNLSNQNPPESSITPRAEENEAMMENEIMMEKATYQSGAIQDFNQAAYEKALADGKTVFLDFHADWCPVCVENKPKIKAAFEKADQNTVGFIVNYDTEKELRKKYNVTTQSTYILVKGDETERIIGAQTEDQFMRFISIEEGVMEKKAN